jgi:hypothetical protein
MMIIKNDQYGRFTVYPTNTLDLLRGHSDAIALHLYLVSKPNDWTVRSADIESALGFGRDRRRKAMGVLMHKGLAKLRMTPYSGSEWDIYAEPRETDSQATCNPVDRETTPIVNTNKILNTEDTKEQVKSDQFEVFWGLYPNKKAKAPARAKWLRLTADQIDAALADVKKRPKGDPDWAKENGKYVPMAQTYINQERWDDEWDSSTVSQASIPDWML